MDLIALVGKFENKSWTMGLHLQASAIITKHVRIPMSAIAVRRHMETGLMALMRQPFHEKERTIFSCQQCRLRLVCQVAFYSAWLITVNVF